MIIIIIVCDFQGYKMCRPRSLKITLLPDTADRMHQALFRNAARRERFLTDMQASSTPGSATNVDCNQVGVSDIDFISETRRECARPSTTDHSSDVCLVVIDD